MIQMDSSQQDSSGSEVDSYDETSEEECGMLGFPFPGLLNVQMKAKTMPGNAFTHPPTQSPVTSDVLDTSCNDLDVPTPERVQADNHSYIQTRLFGSRDLSSKFVKIENALNPIHVKQEDHLNVAVQTGPLVHNENLAANIDCSPIIHSDISDFNSNTNHSESRNYSNLYNSDDFFNGEEDWSPSSSDRESAPENAPVKRSLPKQRNMVAGDNNGSDSCDSDGMCSPKKRRKRAYFLSSSSESSWCEDDDEKQELISKGICPYCEKQFNRQSALKGHMLLCNTDLKGRRGSSEGLSSANNTPIKKFRAKRPKKLTSKSHDKKELKANVKVAKRRSQCGLCTARFHSYPDLVKHMRIHASEVSQTGKRSTRSEKSEDPQCTIKEESMENEDSNYIRLFRELKSLGDTSWSVQPNEANTSTQQNEDDDNHNCLYCSKTFFRKAALESHVKIHSVVGGPPVNSPRTRARSFALNRKMRLNGSSREDLRVYYCEVCSDCFPRRAMFIAHMKDHALRQMIDSPKLNSILRSNCSFTIDEISIMNQGKLDMNGNQSAMNGNQIGKSDQLAQMDKRDIFKNKDCRIVVPRIKTE